MDQDPIKSHFAQMASMLCLICLAYIGMNVMFYVFENSTNETEQNQTEASFVSFLNNASSNTTTYYQNITILDKEHKQRSFRSDVYNVVYKTEDGDIQRDNNMTLYYLVDEGHSYNVSGMYQVRGIVGEI